jgi:hypothetical protein
MKRLIFLIVILSSGLHAQLFLPSASPASVVAAVSTKADTLVPSIEVWVDGNRTDSYVPKGTMDKPFKVISDGLTYLSAKGGGIVIVKYLRYKE